MEAIAIAALSLLLSLFQFEPIDRDLNWEYHCGDVFWMEAPRMVEGDFHGKVALDCSFTSLQGGGYGHLKEHLIERLLKGAHQVHSGPDEETYQGMNSTFIDATLRLQSEGTVVFSRQDNHLATDDQTKLLSDSFSTQITGEGNAEYLLKADAGFEIEQITQQPSWHQARIWTRTIVDKPWYVPGGIFRSEVQDRLEKEMTQKKEKILLEFARNL